MLNAMGFTKNNYTQEEEVVERTATKARRHIDSAGIIVEAYKDTENSAPTKPPDLVGVGFWTSLTEDIFLP